MTTILLPPIRSVVFLVDAEREGSNFLEGDWAALDAKERAEIVDSLFVVFRDPRV
jgi:hypothetical protein